MTNLGAKIRQLREEKGLTQEQLAHLVGYKSRVSINKIELQRDIPIKKVVPIAKALGVDPAELLGWTDEPLTFDFTPEEEEQELLALWRNASEHIKDSVMILLKSEL